MELSEIIKKQSLEIVRNAIREKREEALIDETKLDPYLKEKGACFVTLQIEKSLRGCIGTLEAHQALHSDMAQNAFNAAFRDPRFAPVGRDELDQIHIHISILTPPEPLPVITEADLLQKLIPHTHGLIIQEGRRRATFLPSVWEQLSDPQEFLMHLKMKAGFSSYYWSPHIKCFTYKSLSIAEED